jgi:hypothetical protein
LIGQTNFSNKGFVTYTFTPNTSANSRFGLIEIDGYNFLFEQEGTSSSNSCPGQVTPNYIHAPNTGGVYTLYVYNWTGNQSWSVNILPNDINWISSVQSPQNTNADITISPNYGGDRITYITIANAKIPIIQDGL